MKRGEKNFEEKVSRGLPTGCAPCNLYIGRGDRIVPKKVEFVVDTSHPSSIILFARKNLQPFSPVRMNHTYGIDITGTG
jgi:hypothetical protein